MSTVARLRAGGASAALRRLDWQHPEWWAVALAAVCWGGMVTHALQHGAHAHHHLMTTPAELLHWLLMVIAMMVPLMLDPVRMVAFRSYRHRRHIAIATFLVGYLAVWWAAGLPVAWLRSLAWSHTHHTAAVAFALSALWLLSPLHDRALKSCHGQRPIAPSGWPAIRDACVHGMRLGGACVVSCWPLMVACTLTGHSLIAMLGGAAVSVLERLSFRPPTRMLMLLTLGLSGWHVALVLST